MSETDGFSNEISDNAFHSLLKSFFDTDSVRSNEEHIFLKFKSAKLIYTFLTNSMLRFQTQVK